MEGKLTFLGTGTSMGVPSLGCACAVCTSSDLHDKRSRPSVLVTWEEDASGPERAPDQKPNRIPDRDVVRSVVIDTGPDFREQALRADLKRVDAVFYTHGHADHVLGMDDLRPLSFTASRESGPIPLYAAPETIAILEKIFDYTFSPDATYINRARVRLAPLADRNPVHGVDFVRVPVMHGKQAIDGFRFGRAAYLTDVSAIPETSLRLLEGLEVLVLSALRHAPHPSHATVEQALEWAERIGAQQTWFTHIAHDLGHRETNAKLPAKAQLAYDGLSVPVTL
jgi:phosphoribosyl 1,2-cyclic phosphate phosphodiesterase